MRVKLSENIKKFRNERKMTQEQLAEATGVSVSAVYKWESNKSTPEINLILEMADLFEVSIDTLIGHTLRVDRMDALITQMEKAVDDRDEETAESLCKIILRNYHNNSRAVEACSNGYYNL